MKYLEAKIDVREKCFSALNFYFGNHFIIGSQIEVIYNLQFSFTWDSQLLVGLWFVPPREL